MTEKAPHSAPTTRTALILCLSGVIAVVTAALTIQSDVPPGLGIVTGGGAFTAAFEFFNKLTEH